MTGVETAAALAAAGTAAGGTAAAGTAAGLTAAEIAAAAAAAEAAGTGIAATTGAGLLDAAATAAATEAASAGIGTAATEAALGGAAEGGLLGGFAPQTMGVNELGLQGISSLSANPTNTQFMTLGANELGAVGGTGQSLASTTADAMAMPASSSGMMSAKDAFDLAQKGYKMANGQQEQQQPGRAPLIPGSPEAMAKQKQEFTGMSPYANPQRFNPRRYGANVRQGLLG